MSAVFGLFIICFNPSGDIRQAEDHGVRNTHAILRRNESKMNYYHPHSKGVLFSVVSVCVFVCLCQHDQLNH